MPAQKEKRYMAQHLSGPSNLTGQVALITGGAGGMGHAIANVFKAASALAVSLPIPELEPVTTATRWMSDAILIS
jgi:hypothetical protein